MHRVGRAARAGRTGTALSLVSPDELPHMLDVMLFLGRSVDCANVAPKSVGPEQIRSPDHMFYGRLPSELVSTEMERVDNWKGSDSWLSGMAGTVANGYKAYHRSRVKASPQSVRRFRKLGQPDLHPWFAVTMKSEEKEKVDLVQELRNFRPRGHVFELSGSQLKRSGRVIAAAKGPPKPESEDEEEETAADAKLSGMGVVMSGEGQGKGQGQGKSSKKRSRGDTSRDDAFFISGMPTNSKNQFYEDSLSIRKGSEDKSHTSVLEDAVLDMVGDDTEGLLRNRSSMKWDKRKKKYVESNSQSGDKGPRKSVINESGAAVYKADRNKKSAYESWSKRNGKIPKAGTFEDEDKAKAGSKHFQGRAGQKYRHNTKVVANADAASELRDGSQVQKERKQKEKLRARIAARGGRGGRGRGGRGGRGPPRGTTRGDAPKKRRKGASHDVRWQ